MASVGRDWWAYSECRRFNKSDGNGFGSTGELHQKLLKLSAEEGSGTPGVAVECVDIGKNANGEGRSLGRY